MNINPEIIGFVAGGLSSALFIPQIIKILKEKSAEEISLLTCIIGILSSGLWLWYGIVPVSYTHLDVYKRQGLRISWNGGRFY